jgi:Cu-processing system permease protein
MKAIFLIALNTNLEYRREKLFISILFMAIGLIALSLFLGAFSFSEKMRVIVHLGLSVIQLSLWVLAAFLAAGTIHREMERQTCLMILARPLERKHFLIGKFLGLALVLIQAFLLLLLTVALLVFYEIPIFALIQSASALLFEALVIAAMALFFSMFLRPTLAACASLSITLTSYWWPDFAFFAEKSKDPILVFVKDVLAWSIPQFHKFNFKSLYWIEQGGDLKLFLMALLHGLIWSTLMLVLANVIFEKKDLN